MNTKQKLRISNLVNFCFFILALFLLINKVLHVTPVVGVQSNYSDFLYIPIILLIILLTVYSVYYIPSTMIINSVPYISFPKIELNTKIDHVFNNTLFAINKLNKRLSVFRC